MALSPARRCRNGLRKSKWMQCNAMISLHKCNSAGVFLRAYLLEKSLLTALGSIAPRE